MVINVINIQYVAAGKAKDHPPVGANRSITLVPAFKRVQPEPRHVQIRNRTGSIQTREDVKQLLVVLPHHATRVVVFVKAFQPLMADRPDHAPTVMRYVTHVNRVGRTGATLKQEQVARSRASLALLRGWEWGWFYLVIDAKE